MISKHVIKEDTQSRKKWRIGWGKQEGNIPAIYGNFHTFGKFVYIVSLVTPLYIVIFLTFHAKIRHRILLDIDVDVGRK